jgi:hypothetical protein
VLLAAGMVAVVALILFLVLRDSGGSSHGSAQAVSAAAGKSSAAGSPSAGRHSGGSAASSPAQMNVVVLNGTTTTGLAHYVSGQLRQNGFARASALTGRPPGANQVTVVEYAGGHRADAARVARALGVAQPQPIEGTVASLSGSATVVVIVGLDRASTVP